MPGTELTFCPCSTTGSRQQRNPSRRVDDGLGNERSRRMGGNSGRQPKLVQEETSAQIEISRAAAKGRQLLRTEP